MAKQTRLTLRCRNCGKHTLVHSAATVDTAWDPGEPELVRCLHCGCEWAPGTPACPEEYENALDYEWTPHDTQEERDG